WQRPWPSNDLHRHTAANATLAQSRRFAIDYRSFEGRPLLLRNYSDFVDYRSLSEILVGLSHQSFRNLPFEMSITSGFVIESIEDPEYSCLVLFEAIPAHGTGLSLCHFGALL